MLGRDRDVAGTGVGEAAGIEISDAIDDDDRLATGLPWGSRGSMIVWLPPLRILNVPYELADRMILAGTVIEIGETGIGTDPRFSWLMRSPLWTRCRYQARCWVAGSNPIPR